MKPADPLLARWQNILGEKRELVAVSSSRGEVLRRFEDIEQCARNLEPKIEPIGAGGVLAVQIGNHEDWPSIFLACLRRNVVVLPLEQSVAASQRDAALAVCRANAIIEKSGSVRAIQVERVNWQNRAPSLLKLTSGTTASPRAIRLRSAQLLADCDQICDTMGISDSDLNFGVIPISHSYGFSNLLTPLIARGVPIVMSQDRIPRAVLHDLAATNATVFPGMPVFYQAFCEMENVPALPKLRLCISAGAPLPVAVARRFREKFGLTVHSFYGASECGGICYDREAKNEIDGFVGTPMKGVDLEMIDPRAESSQLRVRSVAAGDGYFPETDEEKLGNGIFIPDDMLTRETDGYRIVGRVSDLINVAGKKVNPAEIEEVLLKFPGVRQAVAFGRESTLRNEEVAACVVGDTDLNERTLLQFCGRQLSAWQVPKRIFVLDSIPTNERGKTSRRALAERFRA
jgi:long-chain acyl-CoA synthetase